MLKALGIFLLVAAIATIGGALMFLRPPASLADLRASYDTCVAEPDRPVSAVIRLDVDTPDDKAMEVVTLLEGAAGATSVVYIDKDATWEQFVEYYKDQPDVQDLATADDMQPSIEADFETRMQADAMQANLEGNSAVSDWKIDTDEACREPQEELTAKCATEEKGRILVWMDTDVSPSQIDSARTFLADSSSVQSSRHVDRDETWQEFVWFYIDQPEVLDRASPSLIPTSFEVILTPDGTPGIQQSTADEIGELPGVDKVSELVYSDSEVASLCNTGSLRVN